MKAVFFSFATLFCSMVAAQNSSDSGEVAPIIITPGANNSLEQLSPALRPGRRGGVFVTGAAPSTMTTGPAPLILVTTNTIGTNTFGATGSGAVSNIGVGASAEMPGLPTNGIFVPTFNNPGLPGAIGGRGLNPTAPGATAPNPPPPNSAPGIATPAVPVLPPAGTTEINPPPAPAVEPPGNRVVPPPRPITTPPPPISGSRR